MSTGICQEAITKMELLRTVRIIDPVQQRDQLADVLIIKGRIEALAEKITDYPAQATVFPPSGLILGTGLADLYSHSGEPGYETRETLGQLSQAAAAGGFTQVGILPDTMPMIDNVETLAAIKQKSNYLSSDSQLNLPQLHFWGSAWNCKRRKMNALGELEAEVIGFATSHNLGNLDILKQILEYVQPLTKTIAIALHQNELGSNGVVREGEISIRYGMAGNPSYSEAAAIAAVLEMAAEIPVPIHLMRVSTKRGVELIADAKTRGVNVTASTTWMHLLRNSEAVGSYNPNLRIEPPLGNESDRHTLAEGVRQGIIDAIVIDHHAYTYEEKTVAFALAPPGAIGLELALPLLWQKFVATEEWTAIELWQALSSRPHQCLQQEPKAIAIGQSANLVLFNPEQTWTASVNNLKSPAANTPWYKQEIIGKVIKTWVN
ncbi:MAG: dihydroorotase [Cyanobacteria bacterium P01_A01_bin.83]